MTSSLSLQFVGGGGGSILVVSYLFYHDRIPLDEKNWDIIILTNF